MNDLKGIRIIITAFIICSMVFLLILKLSYKGFTYFEWFSILANFLGAAVGGIATLIALCVSTRETRKIQSDINEEKRNEYIKLEEKRIKNAVKMFESKVIGQYVDVRNSGRSYEVLKSKIDTSSVERNFIDIRNLFIDGIEFCSENEYTNKYLKIQNFYSEKAYGEYNGADYVFAKDYVELIKELNLHKEMELIRENINT